MPVGFGPWLLLEGKRARKAGALIALAAGDSSQLEGVCHGVGPTFSYSAWRCPSALLAKEQVSVTEMGWVYMHSRLRLSRDRSNGNHESG